MRAGQRSAASSVRNSIPPPRVRASISDMPLTAVLRSIGCDARCCRREKARSCSVSLAPRCADRVAVCTILRSFWSVPSRISTSSRLPKIAVSRLLKSCARPPVNCPRTSILEARLSASSAVLRFLFSLVSRSTASATSLAIRVARAKKLVICSKILTSLASNCRSSSCATIQIVPTSRPSAL